MTIAEWSIYGMFFPVLLLQAMAAFGVSWVVRYGMARVGLYRWIWHPALFDTALFIVLWYGVFWCTPFLIHYFKL